MNSLANKDPSVAAAIADEGRRQRSNIVLIASENYASRAVLEAQGSYLTNKYAEGYPGRRYYGGCEFVDIVEQLAIDRATRLFGTDHANVQSHAGAQANMSAYFALIDPGDTVMGMRLDQGGHLTHGSPVNFSGNLYNFVPYGVDPETEQIDYEEVLRLATKHQPKLIVAGYTAYPRAIDFPRFAEIARITGAILMVDMAHIAGLVASGAHPSPIGHAQVITSTTHKTLRGPRGAMILCEEQHAKAIDRAVFPFTQGGPMMHAIAAKAVCFNEALDPSFSDYGQKVVANARELASSLEAGGLRIVSGGTDTHLILVDLTPLGCSGRDAESSLASVHITANKNAIPNDILPPRITSGLRLGTAAITSRGFGLDEAHQIGQLIVKALTNLHEPSVQEVIRQEVLDLTSRFPVPGLDF